MSEPNISVVMPVFNSAAYLKVAIESILTQSLENFELIIVNDGSIDHSQEIINQLSFQDQRIRSFIHPANFGISTARNLAINMARGKYVAIQDSDDIANVKRLEIQFQYLEENRNIDILGTSMQIIENNKVYNLDEHYLNDAEIKAAFITLAKNIFDPTAMFRRSVWLENQTIRYNSQLTAAEDLDLWLQCMQAKLHFANLPDHLVQYRVHSAQCTNNTKRMVEMKNIVARKALSLFLPNLSYEEIMIVGAQLAVFINKPLVIDYDIAAFTKIINKCQSLNQTIYGENRDFINSFLNHLLADFIERKENCS